MNRAKENTFFSMRNIVKQYKMGEEIQTILKGIDLDIEEGEFLSVLGPSGSGKSTLMNIIGCLDTPTSGEYILHGRVIRDLDQKQLARIRSVEIGFIFQQFQLLPRLDAMKNVELPLVYAGVPPRERARRAEEMLVRVGLQDKLHHNRNQLSGRQQQRVACLYRQQIIQRHHCPKDQQERQRVKRHSSFSSISSLKSKKRFCSHCNPLYLYNYIPCFSMEGFDIFHEIPLVFLCTRAGQAKTGPRRRGLRGQRCNTKKDGPAFIAPSPGTGPGRRQRRRCGCRCPPA